MSENEPVDPALLKGSATAAVGGLILCCAELHLAILRLQQVMQSTNLPEPAHELMKQVTTDLDNSWKRIQKVGDAFYGIESGTNE